MTPTIRMMLLALLAGFAAPASAQNADRVILEDFRSASTDGFPAGWQNESGRTEARAREAYKIGSDDSGPLLKVRNTDQRIKKKEIVWNPKTHPILTWRWRLHKAVPGTEPIAVVYAALDTDLMFIPVFTKYVWSATKPVGTATEGGMFSGAEIVVRSGAASLDTWIEERVNVYEDFKRIHRHEPAKQAWGISLFAGPGVEIDFSPIAADAK
ncbi:MAG TPA: DUF3047 domain-containing protein [Nitrospirales bacterium]|nr:DUF3047 domain-containing protein [Nitrospirales bacterium]